MSWNEYLIDNLMGRRVFITGHTGFKGSWLTTWLSLYKCHITGYALPATTTPNIYQLAHIEKKLSQNHYEDIRDQQTLNTALCQAQPELVIHLAAQPIVRTSYSQPVETWSTNVMGTVHLLEAVRMCPSIRAVLVITSDKCYENHDWHWGYREIDTLGGHDPYSASKACCELVVQSYRKSFFHSGGPYLASARAGNVIGGGDWSIDRLIPDAVRSAQSGTPLCIRNPLATRPWQHVLDCLQGYLLLACKLLDGNEDCANSFNFGPTASDNKTVSAILELLRPYWPTLVWHDDPIRHDAKKHEANYLYLDSSKARHILGWEPQWDLNTALERTASWYSTVLDHPEEAPYITEDQIKGYLDI